MLRVLTLPVNASDELKNEMLQQCLHLCCKSSGGSGIGSWFSLGLKDINELPNVNRYMCFVYIVSKLYSRRL